MSNTMKDTDFLFLSAMLKVREAKMLTREKAERMLDAASFEECAKLLTDCGYEDMSQMNAAGIEKVLGAHRSAILTELAQKSPRPELIDIFRLKYDYHNAKTLIKAQGVGEDGARLLSGAGRVEPKALAAAFENDDYTGVPAAMGEAMRDAAGILARTANPQLADLRLDGACYAELSAMAQELGNDFLKGYAALLTDGVNLRTAVRVLRMKKSAGFLKTALLPGGAVSTDAILAAEDAEGLAAVFRSTPLALAADLGAQAAQGGRLTPFELACDNAATAYLGAAALKGFGAEAVVSYLARLENEITAIRMILTGRLAGIDANVMRERLREIC